MDPFASYAHVENPQQFWAELDEILDAPFHYPSSTTFDSALATNSHHDVDVVDSHKLQAKKVYVTSILSKFLQLCAACFDTNLSSEYNQDYCINRLFSSAAFRDDTNQNGSDPIADAIPMHQLAAEEAIRTMQTSTSIPVLLMTYEIVLQYGDAFPSTYKSIQASATAVSFVGLRAFLHRLVHQIWAGSYAAQTEAKIGISDHDAPIGWAGADCDPESAQQRNTASLSLPPSTPLSATSRGLTSSSASKDIAIQISLRQKAVRMLYEVCRVQKLEVAHLKAFDERFIHHLFDLVEETRYHRDEDFNYRLIKLLVAMNEQYMVATLTSTSSAASNAEGQINSLPPTAVRPTNLVLSVLQQRLNASKTFGENLIFMLNRASSSDAEDVCMQLLVLKLLYLLFTTKETAGFFYTNDLRVLVDIFIRELSDLPDESESLRHTYLRVLHPLLTNTQLCTYAYKRPQIRRLLLRLVSHGHLRDISATTKRLVERCLRAEWCVELDKLDGTSSVATVAPIGGGQAHEKKMHGGVTSEGLPMLSTEIKENNKDVEATTKSITITTDDVAVSPTDAVVSPAPSIISPVFPHSSNSITNSIESQLRRPTGGSLSVPSTLRSRDKRVLSVSHPKAASSVTDPPPRPGSAAAHSHHQPRRAVSAQSAPCTPPRSDSPADRSSTSRFVAQPSGIMDNPLNSPPLDGDADDALSVSSSWHAHMAEDRPAVDCDRTKLAPIITAKDSTSASCRSSASAMVLSQLANHPLHSSSQDSTGYSARVGSPLIHESTPQMLNETSSWGQVPEQSLLTQVEQLHSTTDLNPIKSGGHAQQASDSTVIAEAVTPAADPVVISGSTVSCAGSGPDAPKRRKPPRPPTQSRRAMQVSNSEPHFSSSPAESACSSSGHLAAAGSESRSNSGEADAENGHHSGTYGSSSYQASDSSSRPESPYTNTDMMEASTISTSTTASNPSTTTGRRRPPPPPPPSSATASTWKQRLMLHTSNNTSAPDLHHHQQQSPSEEAATSIGEEEAAAVEKERQHLSETQSFHIAERLRRGLRIR